MFGKINILLVGALVVLHYSTALPQTAYATAESKVEVEAHGGDSNSGGKTNTNGFACEARDCLECGGKVKSLENMQCKSCLVMEYSKDIVCKLKGTWFAYITTVVKETIILDEDTVACTDFHLNSCCKAVKFEYSVEDDILIKKLWGTNNESYLYLQANSTIQKDSGCVIIKDEVVNLMKVKIGSKIAESCTKKDAFVAEYSKNNYAVLAVVENTYLIMRTCCNDGVKIVVALSEERYTKPDAEKTETLRAIYKVLDENQIDYKSTTTTLTAQFAANTNDFSSKGDNKGNRNGGTGASKECQECGGKVKLQDETRCKSCSVMEYSEDIVYRMKGAWFAYIITAVQETIDLDEDTVACTDFYLNSCCQAVKIEYMMDGDTLIKKLWGTNNKSHLLLETKSTIQKDSECIIIKDEVVKLMKVKEGSNIVESCTKKNALVAEYSKNSYALLAIVEKTYLIMRSFCNNGVKIVVALSEECYTKPDAEKSEILQAVYKVLDENQIDYKSTTNTLTAQFTFNTNEFSPGSGSEKNETQVCDTENEKSGKGYTNAGAHTKSPPKGNGKGSDANAGAEAKATVEAQIKGSKASANIQAKAEADASC